MSDDFDPRTARAEIAMAGARSVTAECSATSRARTSSATPLFASLLFFAIAIALAGLMWLIADSLIEGAPRLNADLFTEPELVAAAQRRARSRRSIGTLWIMAS